MSVASDNLPTKIYVVNPTKVGEGYKSFILYSIRCEQENAPVIIVERRYNDFVWLRERLFESVPGAIIPPIPLKSYLNRFDEEFIERRRRGLEKFLCEILAHDALKLDPTLHLFLSAKRSVLLEEQKAVVKPKWGFFKNIRNQMATKPEATENDAQCLRIRDFSAQLQEVLNTLNLSIRETQMSWRKLSESWWDVGVELYKLAEFGADRDLNGLADVAQLFASTTYHYSVSLRQAECAEAENFEDEIGYQASVVDSVQRVLKDRQAMLETWTYESGQLDKLYNNQTKHSGEKLSKFHQKITKQENTVRKLEEQLLEQTDRIFKEFEQFQEDFELNMLDTCIATATRHFDHASSLCNFWRTTLKDLELKKASVSRPNDFVLRDPKLLASFGSVGSRFGSTFDRSKMVPIPKRPARNKSMFWNNEVKPMDPRIIAQEEESDPVRSGSLHSNIFTTQGGKGSIGREPADFDDRKLGDVGALHFDDERQANQDPTKRQSSSLEPDELESPLNPSPAPPPAPPTNASPNPRRDSPPPTTTTKNRPKGLMAELLDELGGDDKLLNRFRVCSVEFRHGNLTGEEYFQRFLELFGPATCFGTDLFPRIVNTLPDANQQGELKLIYARETAEQPHTSSNPRSRHDDDSSAYPPRGSNSRPKSPIRIKLTPKKRNPSDARNVSESRRTDIRHPSESLDPPPAPSRTHPESWTPTQVRDWLAREKLNSLRGMRSNPLRNLNGATLLKSTVQDLQKKGLLKSTAMKIISERDKLLDSIPSTGREWKCPRCGETAYVAEDVCPHCSFPKPESPVLVENKSDQEVEYSVSQGTKIQRVVEEGMKVLDQAMTGESADSSLDARATYQRQHRRELSVQAELDEQRSAIQPLVDSWIRRSGKFRGKYGNVVIMLSDLHSIFPYFQPPERFRIDKKANQSKVKKMYLSACKVVHPDKNANAEMRRRALSNSVFAALHEAYDRYMRHTSNA